MVLYILAILALMGCLAFLFLQIRKQRDEYTALVQQVQDGETLEILGESWAKEDPEEASEDSEEEQTQEEASVKISEKPTPTSPPAPTEIPTPTAEPQPDYQAKVLVLNGTGKEGLAGKWASSVAAAGYGNVKAFNYTGAVDNHTVIYASSEEAGKPFLTLFPNGEVRVGSIQEGIVEGTATPVSQQADIYIVLGTSES